VQPRDEYNRIHDQLEPFWGVPPHILHQQQAFLEYQHDTFIIGKVRGSSTISLSYTFGNTSNLAMQAIRG